MSTVTVTRLINADIETVWAELADVRLVADWHPGVATTDLLSAQPTGVGATRRCNFYDGTDVIEEIVDVGDDYNLQVEIREFKAPMKSFHANWHLTATPTGATQVTVTMEYEMRLSILGTAMDVLVIKGRMPKLLNKVLAGLEHHVTSGQIVEQDFEPAAEQTPAG